MSLVTILPDKRRLFVNGNGTGPLGSTDGAELVTGMPRNYLTPGHDYVFIVTGQVGAMFNNGTPTTYRSAAEVFCGLSDGRFYGDRHRVSMFAPNLFGPGNTTLRSHPFKFIFGVANLPTDTDFLLFARTWNREGGNYRGAFQMDCVTILAYDLTLLGPNNYRLNSASFSPVALPYRTAAAQLVLAPTVDTAGDWLAYYTAEMQPGSREHPCNAWLDHLTQPTWGPTNETWGHDAMGSTGRGGGNDREKDSYSMGLWGVFGMQANHAFGVRGRSMQWIWQGGAQSTATRAAVFAVRTAVLPGFQYERAGFDGIDLYAEGVGHELSRVWHQPGHMPGAVMVSGCPVSPRKSYALGIYYGAKRVTTDAPLHVYVQDHREGIPEQRAGESPFYQGPNEISLTGIRNRLDSPLRITNIGGNSPQLHDINLITTGSTTVIRSATLHGWSGTVDVAVQGCSTLPEINGLWRDAVVNGANTVELPVATQGYPQPSGSYSDDGQTILTTAAPHDIPTGKERSIRISGVAGNVPPLLGVYVARALDANRLAIPVRSTTFGSGGDLSIETATYKSRYLCLIGMGLNEQPDTILRAKELPGPEVQIVPDREAPNIYALPDLPYPPQEGVGIQVQTPVGELRNVYGDPVTWPLSTEVAEQMSFRWTLGAEKADALLEFFAGLGAGAFRTVLPREEVGGDPTAFVLLGAPIQQVDDEAGQRFTIAVNVAKLRWIGP